MLDEYEADHQTGMNIVEIAEEIYQYMSKGFPVICYYYEVDPLAAPEPPAAVPAPPGEGQGTGTGQAGSEGQGAGAVQPEGIGEGTGE